MAEVKWIKITTDIFDDDKILLIESLPEADSLIVIWFKLLCLAGKQNNSGVFLMNDRIAYTDKMLATIFRRKDATVQLALNTFQEFGMIEIVDGVITIPNWGKHQNLDQLENKKEYMRSYMREYRQKQKKLACKSESSKSNRKTNNNVNDNANVDTNSETNVSEADKEESKDIEQKEIREENLTLSIERVCRTKDVRLIIDAWNKTGLKKVVSIDPKSDRGKQTRKRVNDFGVETVIKAIQKVGQSKFCAGDNKRGWTATYDWFIRPSNFQKCLEGNYDDRVIKGEESATGNIFFDYAKELMENEQIGM